MRDTPMRKLKRSLFFLFNMSIAMCSKTCTIGYDIRLEDTFKEIATQIGNLRHFIEFKLEYSRDYPKSYPCDQINPKPESRAKAYLECIHYQKVYWEPGKDHKVPDLRAKSHYTMPVKMPIDEF